MELFAKRWSRTGNDAAVQQVGEIDAVMNVNGGQKNESGCIKNDFDLQE